ncbi:hypothetical protein Hanom_Chr01g00005531 [Helianthus anomalus]
MTAARRRQNPRRRPVHRRITPAVRIHTGIKIGIEWGNQRRSRTLSLSRNDARNHKILSPDIPIVFL